MLKLLIKTLVLTFFRQHAGLFIVAIYLLFGMIQGYDLIAFHYALVNSICSSLLNMSLVFVFWTIYAMRSIFFIKQNQSLDEYRFTSALLGLHKKVQIRLWSKVYSIIFLPMLAYGLFMMVISLKNGYYPSFISTVVMLAILIFGSAFITYRSTNFTFKPVHGWISFPSLKLKTGFLLWPIIHLLKNQPVILLLCKITSLIFLKAVLAVFSDVGDDLRVYLTAMFAAVLSHSMLLTNLIKFDASYLTFAKSLAIHPIKRLLFWLIIFGLLLVPELSILAWHTTLSFSAVSASILFGLSSLVFLQVLFYLMKGNAEIYLRSILFFFFVVMIVILAGQYLLISVSMLLFTLVFYLFRYEKLDLKTYA